MLRQYQKSHMYINRIEPPHVLAGDIRGQLLLYNEWLYGGKGGAKSGSRSVRVSLLPVGASFTTQHNKSNAFALQNCPYNDTRTGMSRFMAQRHCKKDQTSERMGDVINVEWQVVKWQNAGSSTGEYKWDMSEVYQLLFHKISVVAPEKWRKNVETENKYVASRYNCTVHCTDSTFLDVYNCTQFLQWVDLLPVVLKYWACNTIYCIIRSRASVALLSHTNTGVQVLYNWTHMYSCAIAPPARTVLEYWSTAFVKIS